MFTLLSGFYEELTFVPERRVILLGLKSAGKTALLECMKLDFPVKQRSRTFTSSQDVSEKHGLPAARLAALTPTVGLNVARLPTGAEKLLIWDLGGAEPLRPIWNRYIGEAEALIWVVDAADPDTMEESRKCLEKVLEKDPLRHAPLLVFANKQDQPDALDPVRASLALDLLSDAETRPQCVQPSSAITGAGVTEGVRWLVHRLRNPSEEIKTSVKGT
jgi:small GTP-binding protein